MLISFITNGLIALLLSIYVFKKKNVYFLFFALFLYITLHYSYSAIFTIFYPQDYRVMHKSTQIGAKLTGIGFLLFTIIMLIWQNKKHIKNQLIGVNKYFGFWFILWALTVIIYWIIKGTSGELPTPSTVQNFFSSCLLCIISLGFGTVLSQQQPIKSEVLVNFYRIIVIVFSAIIMIAAYEMVNFNTFNRLFKLDSNTFVFRASFPLFNPNLLGFWCAFVALFAGYFFHTKALPKRFPVTVLILCGFGIFLSGSRSIFIVCFFTFSIITILLFLQTKNRLKLKEIFLPVGASVLPVIAGIIIIKLGNVLTNSKSLLMNALTSLADRFVSMPRDVIVSVISKFSKNISLLNDIDSSQHLSKTTIKSIQGRLSSEILVKGKLSTDIVDNGYLAMLHDTGWTGLMIWIFIWIYLIYIGIKVLRISPGIRSVYTLSILLGCAFSAIFLRAFQVFPFWVMIAMALGLSLSWFQIVLAGNFLCEYSSELD